MARDRKQPLPTVRHIDSEEDVYAFEMLRRLLLEIRKSSPLLRTLRDEVLKSGDDTDDAGSVAYHGHLFSRRQTDHPGDLIRGAVVVLPGMQAQAAARLEERLFGQETRE